MLLIRRSARLGLEEERVGLLLSGPELVGALTLGDRLVVSVPGVVAVVVVKLGLLVVLRPLAAEGVEGGSEAAAAACGWVVDGGRRWGVVARWMMTSAAGASLLLLLVWEKVGLEWLVKDVFLEAGVGVIGLDGRGEAALTVPRDGGGLWEAFLERKDKRRMKRGLWSVCKYI